MTYQLVLTPAAMRRLTALPEPIASACGAFVTGPLLDDPRRVGTPLRAPFEGQRRARRGEYRVRYVIGAGTVTVVDAAYRWGV